MITVKELKVITRTGIGATNTKRSWLMMSDLDDARDTVAKSLIDLCEFKVTLPLTSKTKNIHTNTFIYFEPLPLMDDMDRIYEPMGATRSTRWCFYRKGYWYVKGVEITYAGDNQSMSLTLAPFPTVFEADDLSANTTKSNKASESKASDDGDGIKAPSWLSKSDRAWAEDTVRKAIGSKKGELAKAKAIYKYFKQHYGYSYYSDLRFTSPKGKREQAFKRGSGNCADGANILETLLLTGRINARIKHAPNHYIVKVTVDGKTYWIDNSRSKGIVTWNHVWGGRTSNSEGNITDGKYING